MMGYFQDYFLACWTDMGDGVIMTIMMAEVLSDSPHL